MVLVEFFSVERKKRLPTTAKCFEVLPDKLVSFEVTVSLKNWTANCLASGADSDLVVLVRYLPLK